MSNSNPILTEKALNNIDFDNNLSKMTVANTMMKFVFLLLIMTAGAGAVYYQFSLHHMDYVWLLTIGGMIVGLVLGIITSFNPKSAMYLSPIYAFAQGAFLSGASCFFETKTPGIVIQAVSLTFIVALVMAVLYTTRIIKVTEKFRSILLSITLSIGLFYLISLVLTWGLHFDMPIFYANTPVSIGFSLFVCTIAALDLLLDFDFIERAIENNAPEEFGWYGAFGLLVTIVWLYIEILRLLSKRN